VAVGRGRAMRRNERGKLREKKDRHERPSSAHNEGCVGGRGTLRVRTRGDRRKCSARQGGGGCLRSSDSAGSERQRALLSPEERNECWAKMISMNRRRLLRANCFFRRGCNLWPALLSPVIVAAALPILFISLLFRQRCLYVIRLLVQYRENRSRWIYETESASRARPLALSAADHSDVEIEKSSFCRGEGRPRGSSLFPQLNEESSCGKREPISVGLLMIIIELDHESAIRAREN